MRWTDPVDSRPARHARVWLDRATWRSSVLQVDANDVEPLDRWVAAGRSLVACRRDPAIADACVLGVGLPTRRRLAVVVQAGAVTRVEPPLRLEAVVDAAPAGWRAALRDLGERGELVSTHFHVYGSLAWQAISGDSHIGPASDIDLLWSATSPRQVDQVVTLLLRWEAETGLRADGEALLPHGGGVSWRECAARPERVLVKEADRVSLQRLADCFDRVAA